MSDKLGILFLNPDPRRGAGSNISLLGIIRGLDRTRFHVHMAIPGNNEYKDEINRLGVEIVDYVANNWWYPNSDEFYLHLAGLRARVMRLVSAIRERGIDLVYTNTEYAFEGALAAAIAGIPHIWAQRVRFAAADIDVLKQFPLSEVALAQVMADLSDMVVPNSKATLRSFPASFPSHKMRVIESGLEIPDSLLPKAEGKRMLAALANLPAASKIILTVGRISPEKDLGTFIRTAACVLREALDIDTHFIHVGQPLVRAYEHELGKLCDELGVGDRVHFLGPVEKDRINTIYRGADVFVLTSMNFEGFARVCAEAMVAELPVVSTRCGGPEDYIQEGDTGFLCNVGDAATLAQRVHWLLANPEVGRHMGTRGRVRISEHFDERILNQKWIELFEELCTRPRIVDSKRTLQIELLINVLAHIGQAGVNNHEIRRRLEQSGRLTRLITKNPLAQAIRSLLR